MLVDQELVAFIASSDLDVARAFYRDALGLRLVSEDSFALVFATAGARLRVTAVEAVAVAPYTVVGWSVPEIAAAVDELVARGVAFQRYDGMGQDERGVWTAPSGAKVGWFRDPDGNTLSLTELSG